MRVLFNFEIEDDAYHLDRIASENIRYQLVEDNFVFEELGKNLEDRGVEIKIFPHSHYRNRRKALRELKKEVELADLIFHENYRVPLSTGSNQEIRYGNEVNELIRGVAHKSHIIDENFNNFKKQDVAKVVRSMGIPMPQSWSVEDFPEEELPCILKRNTGSRGDGILYIDKPEQLEKFRHQDKYDQVSVDNSKWEIQEFIETPSDHFTHYRIIITGDETIVASALSVSQNTKNEQAMAEGKSRFFDPESPVYLGCKKIYSNVSQGGFQIPLDRNGYSRTLNERDHKVLEAHGLDPYSPKLPEGLKKMAKQVAREFSKRGVIYSGQDWIQDKQGSFYFLEQNLWPGRTIFNTVFNEGEDDTYTENIIFAEQMGRVLANYKLPSSL